MGQLIITGPTLPFGDNRSLGPIRSFSTLSYFVSDAVGRVVTMASFDMVQDFLLNSGLFIRNLVLFVYLVY